MIGILALLGLVLIVFRFFFRKTLHGASRTSQHFAIGRMKKNPERAVTHADALDMPFTKKKGIGSEAFNRVCSQLQSVPSIGKYKILHTQQIEPSRLLVLTELSFDDYVVDLRGNTYDTKKKALHDFVFRHDPAVNEMDVYSDLANNATEKFQKQEFVQALFESKV